VYPLAAPMPLRMIRAARILRSEMALSPKISDVRHDLHRSRSVIFDPYEGARYGWKESEPRSIDWQSGEGS